MLVRLSSVTLDYFLSDIRHSRYTKGELHKRIASAYAVGLISSAFAGILSFGIGQLDGVRGMSGWRWIFSVGITAPRSRTVC